MKYEARLQQCLLVIEGQAVEKRIALGVDEHLRPVVFKDFVGGPLLGIKPEQVIVATATAALYTEPQSLQLLLLGQRLFDLGNSLGCDVNHGVSHSGQTTSSYSRQWPRGSPPPPAWCSGSWPAAGSARGACRRSSAAKPLRSFSPSPPR